MKMYNFAGLITKYGVNFEIKRTKGGEYIGGRWQEGETETKAGFGAIIPLAERKIYQSGGSYTAKDRQLYMFEPLEGALKNIKVCYKGNIYSVEQETDYSDYSDVFVYLLKYVSLFDKKGSDAVD